MELILRAENALNLDRQEDSLEYLVQHDARCGCVRNTALGSLCGAIDLVNAVFSLFPNKQRMPEVSYFYMKFSYLTSGHQCFVSCYSLVGRGPDFITIP